MFSAFHGEYSTCQVGLLFRYSPLICGSVRGSFTLENTGRVSESAEDTAAAVGASATGIWTIPSEWQVTSVPMIGNAGHRSNRREVPNWRRAFATRIPGRLETNGGCTKAAPGIRGSALFLWRRMKRI